MKRDKWPIPTLHLLPDDLCQLLRASRFGLEKVALFLSLCAHRRPRTLSLTDRHLTVRRLLFAVHGHSHHILRHRQCGMFRLTVLEAEFALSISSGDSLHRHHGLLLAVILSAHFVVPLIVDIFQFHIVLRVMAHYDDTVRLRAARRVRDALLELHRSIGRRVRLRSAMRCAIGRQLTMRRVQIPLIGTDRGRPCRHRLGRCPRDNLPFRRFLRVTRVRGGHRVLRVGVLLNVLQLHTLFLLKPFTRHHLFSALSPPLPLLDHHSLSPFPLTVALSAVLQLVWFRRAQTLLLEVVLLHGIPQIFA